MSINLASSQSSIVTDSFGVSHIVWADNGYIWHAVYDNNSETWKNAEAIAATGTEPVTSINLVADAKLIDGNKPGLSVVWQQGSLNDSDFFYTAAQYDANAELQWLDTPQALTSEQVGDLEPTVLVENGNVLVVGTKVNSLNVNNFNITEDTDLYYQKFQVTSSQFTDNTGSFTAPLAPYSPQLVNDGIVNLGVMTPAPQSNQAVSSQTEFSAYGISTESTSSEEEPGEEPRGAWNAKLSFATNLLEDWKLEHSVPEHGLLRTIINPFMKNLELVGTLSGGTAFPWQGETPYIFLTTNAQLEWKTSKLIPNPWKFKTVNYNSSETFGNLFADDSDNVPKARAKSPLTFGFDMDSTYKFTNTSPHNLISIDDTLGFTGSVKFPIISNVETAGLLDVDAFGSIGLNFNFLASPSVAGGDYFPKTLGAAVKELGGTAFAEEYGTLLAMIFGKDKGLTTAIAADIAIDVAETFADFLLGVTQGLDMAGTIGFPILNTKIEGDVHIPHVHLLSADVYGGLNVAFNWGIGNTNSIVSMKFPLGFDVKLGPISLGFNFRPGWTWTLVDKSTDSASGVSSEMMSSFAVASQPQVSGSLLTIDLGVTPSVLPKPSDFTVTETDITGENNVIPVFNVIQGNTPSTLILQLETPIAVSENYNFTTSNNPVPTADKVSLSFNNSEGITDTENNPIANISDLNVANVTPNQLAYSFQPIGGTSHNYQNSSLLLEINTPLDTNFNPDVKRFSVKKGTQSLAIEKVEVRSNGVLLVFASSVANSDLQNVAIAYDNSSSFGNSLKDTNDVALGSFTVNNGVSTLVSQSSVFITNNNSSLSFSNSKSDYSVSVTDLDGKPITETVTVKSATLNGTDVFLELSQNITPEQNVTIKYKTNQIQTSSLATGVTPSVVSTKSVLSNLEGDLSQDSSPTLSLTKDGEVLLAWVADAPPLEPIAGFANSNVITLNFVDRLGNGTSSIPNTSQFTIKDDQGKVYTATNISVNDSNIKLTLNQSVSENTELTVSYVPSATGTNLTASGARNLYLENTTNQDKLWINGFDYQLNHITDSTSSPNFLGAGAIVENSTTNRITVVFDQPLSGNPINSDFTIKNNGVEYSINSSVTVNSNTVILSVTPPSNEELIGNGDTVTISYQGSSLSANSQPVTPFADRTVITTPTTPTTVIKYGLASASGDSLLTSVTNIPGSGGFNFKPVSALDQKQNNVLVWTYADSSDIKTDLVAGEFYTDNQSSVINKSLQQSDIYYSIYDHTNKTWSLAQPIIEQEGTEGQIAIGTGVDGNLMAAWINYDNEGNSDIYWSSLQYDSNNKPIWSTPAILYTDANPDPLTELEIKTINGKPAVFWTETQATSYSELTFAESPLLYYRLEETGGTTLVNQGIYGAGGNGTYSGTVTFNQLGALENDITKEGDTNPAVLFNNGNSATSSVIPLTGTTFTLEFWFKTPSKPTAKTTLLSSLNLLEVSLGANSALSLNLNNGASLSYDFEGNYQPNTWYSVTATYDGQKDVLDLYLNGKPVANANNVDFTVPSSTIVTLGNASNTTPVYLDEVALYRQALRHSNLEVDIVNDYPLITEDVIADSFSSQFTSFTDTVNDRTPLLYYRLGETEGKTLVNEGVYGAEGNGTYNGYNTKSQLVLTEEGSLVLLSPSGEQLWTAEKNGVQVKGAVQALLQTDGNFVLYSQVQPSDKPGSGQYALWATGTNNTDSGTYLQLDEDGGLRIKNSTGKILKTLYEGTSSNVDNSSRLHEKEELLVGDSLLTTGIILNQDSALFDPNTQEGDRNPSVLFNASDNGAIEDVSLVGNSYGFEFWFKTPSNPTEKTQLLSSSEILEVSLEEKQIPEPESFVRNTTNNVPSSSGGEWRNDYAFAALKDDGSVVTWGNSAGGDSSAVASQLTSGVVEIFSNENAFAALKNDGSVVTWGYYSYGGDSSAVASQLTSGVIEIFSTEKAFAALKDDGSVVTWGANGQGGSSPIMSGVMDISSTGTAFAALKDDGSVVTWGNSAGGDSSGVASQLTSGVVDIFSTYSAFAALKDDGSVITWGNSASGGDSGIYQLNGSQYQFVSSVASQLTSGVVDIFSTYSAFAALKDDGSVVTWGDSASGGDSGTVASQLTSGVVKIFSTDKAFAVLKDDGSVVTWGDSASGGDSGTVASQLTSGVVKIFSTDLAFAALKDNGSVVTWGSYSYGGNSTKVASQLTSGVVEIFSTDLAFAALKDNGSVVTWSDSRYGGNSSGVASQLRSGVVEIFSTGTAFAALKKDGSVVTWGSYSDGGDSSGVASQLRSGVKTIADPLVSPVFTKESTLSVNLNNGKSLTYDFEGNYQPDTWYYVAGNYDGDNQSFDLFVNGESVSNLNNVDLRLPDRTDITLGSSLNQDSVYLDEVAIYGQAVVDRKTVTGLDDLKDLTPSQITEILFNTNQIGNKYASQYVKPLPSGPNTHYVVHDGDGWGIPSLIDPTYKPIATQLNNANKTAWDVTSFTTANTHSTVNPDGKADTFLSLNLTNQTTGSKISSIEVTATNSSNQTITWSVGKTTGNQLAVVQGEKLLNPLNPNGSFEYTILSPSVNLDLFLDAGTNTFSSTTDFKVTVSYSNGTSTSPITLKAQDVTSEPTTINSNQVLGIATVTEANDSSLALIDSGFIVNTNNASIGYVMTSGDFNKDGTIDVAVGNRGYTDTSGKVLGQGTVQILFNLGKESETVLAGKVTKPLTTTDLTGNPEGVLIKGLSDGGQANGDLPFSMATGDVDGDGFIDLIIGDPNVNNKQGAVYVIYGSQMTQVQQNANDEDPIIDVTNLGSKGYKITPTTSGAIAFGYSVAVGNFNNNTSKADIVIGAPGANGGNGAVYVAYDGSSSYSTIYNSTVTGEMAGYSVAVSRNTSTTKAFTGNTTGDDVIIGAIGYTANVSNEWTGLSGLDKSANENPKGQSYPSTSTSKVGAVYVYKSNGTSSNTFSQAFSYVGPNLPSSNGTANDLLAGSALASGDIDGDGQNDLAIAAPGAGDNKGVVYMLKGGQTSNTPLQNLGNVANLQIVGGLPYSQTGSVLSFVGDMNNDKYQDMIITAPQGANGTGQSYVVFGADGLLKNVNDVKSLNVTASDNKRTLLLNGNQPYQLAGSAVTGMGDVNGDFVDDLMISAPNAGQLYTIYGHPWLADDGGIKLANISGDNGFVIDGNLYTVNNSTLAGNGKNVVLLGDVNGDGFADVLSGGSATGGILTFGSSTHNLIDAAAGTDDITITISNQSIAKFLALGDINGDGLQDLGVIDTNNNFYVQLGSDNLPTIGSTLTLSTSSKTSIIDGFAIGDNNGDGYGDVVLRNSNKVWTLYHGSSSGTLNSTTTTFSGLTGNGLGDINGDGYTDIGLGNKDANVNSPNAIGNGQYSVYKGNNKGNTTVNSPDAVFNQVLDSSKWTDQYTIKDEQNNDQTTPTTPTLVKFKGYLYMLYRSNDTSNKLWLQRSKDGVNWEGLTNLGSDFETKYQPSLAVFNNTLYLAFTATTDNVILASAVDDSDAALGIKFDSSKGVFYQIAGNTSEHGPTLVTYKNKLYNFFVGKDKDSTIIYNSTSDPSSSSNWSSNNFVPYSGGNNTTNSRVGATVFKDNLYIGFKSSNSNSIGVTHFDGSKWSSANSSASSQTISGKTSDFGPSLVATNDTIYLFYKSDGKDEEIFYTSSTNGTSWDTDTTVRIPSQSSSDVSSPVLFNQSIYVAHKGFNDDKKIYVTASNPIFEPNLTQQLGSQVQGIGDFNGDGIEDYGVLASGYATFGGFDGATFKNNQGALFIYYGSTSGTINSNPDVVLNPKYSTNPSGISNIVLSNFTAIGDINGDGYDDVAIASPDSPVDPKYTTKDGLVYVVFGGNTWKKTYTATNPFDLNTLSNNQSDSSTNNSNSNTNSNTDSNSSTNNSNTKGFLITGLPSSEAGISLSGGEDVNGDGLDDFMVGAPGNNDNNSYVIFGSDFNKTVTQTGSIGDDVMIGTPTGESFLGDQGNDQIYTNGGVDVVYAGTGDDFVTVNDTYFRRLDGGAGTDVLRFEGYNGQNWDITKLSPGSRLNHWEILVTEGYGANTLTLNSLSVMQLSGNNIITVVMDEKDTLNLSSDFSLNGTVYQYNQKFDKYTSSTTAATILLNRITGTGTTNLITVNKTAPATNTPAEIFALETVQTSGVNSEIAQSPEVLSSFAVDESGNETAQGFGSSVFAGILSDINDTPTQITVSNPIANEADGEVEFLIQRTGNLTQYSQVHYITQDGRAKGGDHYQTVLGRVVFAPGETTKTVAVPLILDDINTGTRDLGLLVTLEEESETPLNHEFHLVADAGESQIRNWNHNITDIPYTSIGGALEFQATTIDGKAEVKLSYEGSKDFNQYFLFNRETQTYEPFTDNGTTGAKFFDEDGDGKNDGAILNFLDGDKYDLDGAQNSLITKRGFFAFADSAEVVLDTAMYRFRNIQTEGTYLYVGAEEKASVLANYSSIFVEEGLAFYVSDTPEDGLIAFNRFQNSNLPGTYLYAGETESQSIRENYPNFVEEGIAFYAYPQGSQMADSISRFQNTGLPGTYLYTAQPETDSVINNYPHFNLEGIAFEAIAA